VSAATVGALLASRRPSHPVGWLLLVVGLSDQFDGLISNYVHYGVMGRSGGLPAASYLSGFYNSGTVVMVACISFIALLTPTGSLPSPPVALVGQGRGDRDGGAAGVAGTRPPPAGPRGPDVQESPGRAADPGRPLTVSAAASAAILLVGLLLPPGRWWSAIATPRAWNVSSCAGWRWRPRWPPRRGEGP
jgi:hypothetical protein